MVLCGANVSNNMGGGTMMLIAHYSRNEPGDEIFKIIGEHDVDAKVGWVSWRLSDIFLA